MIVGEGFIERQWTFKQIEKKLYYMAKTPSDALATDLIKHVQKYNVNLNSKSWVKQPLIHAIDMNGVRAFNLLLSSGVNITDYVDQYLDDLRDEKLKKKFRDSLQLYKHTLIPAMNLKVDTIRDNLEANSATVKFQINAKDYWGLTPLHHACKCIHETLIRLLLTKGADRTVKDRVKKKAPLEYMLSLSDTEILENNQNVYLSEIHDLFDAYEIEVNQK